MAPSPRLSYLVTDQVPPFSKRMASALIYDQVGTHPSITSEWPCAHIWSCKTTSYNRLRKALSPRPSIPGNTPRRSIPRMEIALIFDHVETNPTVISKWPSVPNWAFLVTDQVPPFKEWQLIKWERIPQSHENGHALISDHVKTHPTIISEWPSALDWVFLVTDQEPPFQEWQ